MGIPEYTLSQFTSDLDSTYRSGDADSFWGCEPLMARFLKSGALAALINERLLSMLSDPRTEQEVQIKEVILQRLERWTLSICLFDLPHRYIHAIPYRSFYSPIGQALKAYVYRLPVNYRNDVFDPAIQLEPSGPVTVESHRILRIDSDHFAYDIQVPRPISVLRLSTTAVRPLEWLFSKTTLQAWQANDADLAYTQLRVAATVLGKIAHQSSIQPLKRLAEHKHYAVRWAAIQNLGRVSRSEALLKIREAVNDEHPHVRRAAVKTLDGLNRR